MFNPTTITKTDRRILMRKHSLRLLCCLLLTALASLAAPGEVKAQQQQSHPPYELYRFHMGSTNGFFYTPWYSQGANAGYSFQGTLAVPGMLTVGIYPNPGNGYAPAPSTGLTPLYQYWVVQGFRSYTYLTIWPGGGGSGYTFSGVHGFVYPPSTTVDMFGNPTVKVSAWYSQQYGYWYGLNEPGDQNVEFPPNTTYAWHGVAFRVPFPPTLATAPGRCQAPFFCTGNFAVPYDPPPPPPECDPYQEQYCYDTGGWWDSGGCSCNYYYNNY
jgi:hypothetical protein